jgi:ABC-type nitrate/sulfonate/bicarbonate transport system permease component
MLGASAPLSRKGRIGIWCLRAALGAGLLLAWHLATASGRISALMLPPIDAVSRQFVRIVQAGDFWDDFEVTLIEVVAGFLIAAVSGCFAGYLISRSRFQIRVLEPVLAGLYAVPVIVVYPLYVLFFGLGPASKIALGATIAFFPIVLNTMSAFGNVAPIIVSAARSMGGRGWNMFRYVLLPAAYPVVLAGLRIGFVLSFLSIIGAEMIASYQGIGRLIINQAEAMNTATMYAYIVFLVVIALVVNLIDGLVEASVGRR